MGLVVKVNNRSVIKLAPPYMFLYIVVVFRLLKELIFCFYCKEHLYPTNLDKISIKNISQCITAVEPPWARRPVHYHSVPPIHRPSSVTFLTGPPFESWHKAFPGLQAPQPRILQWHSNKNYNGLLLVTSVSCCSAHLYSNLLWFPPLLNKLYINKAENWSLPIWPK